MSRLHRSQHKRQDAVRITLGCLAVTTNQDVLLGDGEGAMTTDLHERLVEDLAGKGLLDNRRLRAAFQAIRREHFLPGVELERVYHDDAVTTQAGPSGMTTSSSSQPSIMAMMLAQFDPQPGDRVLEIGAGTGYNAALLAHLVGPSGQVTTIDIDPAITHAAHANLDRAGVGANQVEVRTGDGWLGAADRAPFDRIQATVGVWDLAPAWADQLAPTGTLVAPLWLRAGVHATAAFTRPAGDDRLRSHRVAGCGFVRLRGPHAGPADIVEVQSGLLAAVDRVDDAQLALLRGLLATTPVREAAPPIPKGMGWFARLALNEPSAIQLLVPGDEDEEELRGLFDATPTNPGLALVLQQEGQLAAYGNQAALSRLRVHLVRGESIVFHELTIEAIPTDAATAETAPGHGWVLTRPAYRFLMTER
jgi:protein-L-isoaspartate(D-aspartate) O-methyltransferase